MIYHAEYRNVRVKTDSLDNLAVTLARYEIPASDCMLWKDADSVIGSEPVTDDEYYHLLCRCMELTPEGAQDNG